MTVNQELIQYMSYGVIDQPASLSSWSTARLAHRSIVRFLQTKNGWPFPVLPPSAAAPGVNENICLLPEQLTSGFVRDNTSWQVTRVQSRTGDRGGGLLLFSPYGPQPRNTAQFVPDKDWPAFRWNSASSSPHTPAAVVLFFLLFFFFLCKFFS